MAKCQIAEFFLNGFSPHVKLWHLMICQRKRCLLDLQTQIARQIILDKKLCLLQLQFSEKSSQMAEKNKAVCKIDKVLPILTYICTLGFGFGTQPKAWCFSSQILGFGLSEKHTLGHSLVYKQFIKQKRCSGLFWEVGAAEKKATF